MRTPIVSKAQDWCQDSVDPSTADPKTKTLLEMVTRNIMKEFESAMQSCEEVAQAVLEIILGANADLRYQTNEKFGSVEVAAKLADPTGNKSVDVVTERYCIEYKAE